MPKFSKKSLLLLEEAHPDLQKIFTEVIKVCDCTITDSYRDEERQTKLFETCKTHIKWPNSKHNTKPSHAVDVVPKNVNLDNSESTIKQTHYFAGQVMAIASYLYEQKIITSRLVWGGDKKGNLQFRNQNFAELTHFELDI